MSYEALKISHTFSMGDSDMQTYLQHENMLVPVPNNNKYLGLKEENPSLLEEAECGT